MKKRMEAVTVTVTDDNHISIANDNYGGEDTPVVVTPEQVDTLIKWLKEAKAKALKIRV
jgi:hypothetical protein